MAASNFLSNPERNLNLSRNQDPYQPGGGPGASFGSGMGMGA